MKVVFVELQGHIVHELFICTCLRLLHARIIVVIIGVAVTLISTRIVVPLESTIGIT